MVVTVAKKWDGMTASTPIALCFETYKNKIPPDSTIPKAKVLNLWHKRAQYIETVHITKLDYTDYSSCAGTVYTAAEANPVSYPFVPYRIHKEE